MVSSIPVSSTTVIEPFEWIETTEVDAAMKREIDLRRDQLAFSGSLNLFDYLTHYFTSENRFQDRNIIVFQQDALHESDGSINHVPLFELLLAHTFGLTLASELSHRYALKMKPFLTWQDIKEVFIGASAHVKMRDLKMLFYDIKNEINALQCASYLTIDEREMIKAQECFETISCDVLHILLSAFREFRLQSETINPLHAFYDSMRKPQGSHPFRKDYKFLYQLRYLDEIDDEDFHEYFQGHEELGVQIILDEFHGKWIAYTDLQHGEVISAKDRDGYPLLLKVENRLSDRGDGVLGYLLTPCFLEDKSLSLQLNFRGTQFHSHVTNSGASVLRDLDPSGIGKSTFEQRDAELVNMLLQPLKNPHVEKAVLNINGHSLGGIDTQRMLAWIAQLLASDHDEAFDKIEKICICTHNAPGIEASLNERFKRDIAYLETRNMRPQIEISHVLMSGDPVQIGGELYLGAEIDSPLLKRQIVHLSSSQVSLTKVHSTKGFGPGSTPLHYEIIDASQPEVLEAIYGKWIYWQKGNCIRSVCVLLSWALYPFQLLLYLIIKVIHSVVRFFHRNDIPEWYVPIM